MSVVHSQDSEFSKEMRKWNAHHTEFGPPGRPYTYAPYPSMMHKIGRTPTGQTDILERVMAHSDLERESLERRGFIFGGRKEAFEAFARQERELATLAAERNHDVRRMSDKAQQEVATVEANAGARHLGEIPATPIKRKGWPKGKPRTKAEVPA